MKNMCVSLTHKAHANFVCLDFVMHFVINKRAGQSGANCTRVVPFQVILSRAGTNVAGITCCARLR